MSAAVKRHALMIAAAIPPDGGLAALHPFDLEDVARCIRDLADASAERTRADAAEAECARLRAERDAARAEAARLRAAIAAERAVRAAWLATLPACATAPADVVAAEAATGAALDAAGEGR